MASIDKRPNGHYRARWRDYPGGPQHAKHFDRKADAQRFLDRVRGDLAAGTYVDPFAGQVPFGRYAELWRQSQAHRPTTEALVETYLRRHVVPLLGSRPLASIRPSDIQSWANDRASVLAPTTLKVVYRFTAAIFNAAVRDRLIAISPCDQIKLPPVARRQVEPLGTDAIERLASEMPAQYQALVLVAAASGLRQGEMFGLEVRHVDVQRATIRVEQQLVTVGSETFIGPPKTSTSVRTVPVSGLVADQLVRHMAEVGLCERDRHRLVFTNELGRPIKRNRFSETWRAAVERAGLPPGTGFHALRHFYASLLIRHGESPTVVQARLGHATISQTLDTYSHLWPDAADRTREAIDAVLGDALRQARGLQAGRESLHRSIEPPGLGR